jgi:hypothetical protein
MVCSVVGGTLDDDVDGIVDNVVDNVSDVDMLLPSPPPQKQHARLISAWAQLANRFPPWRPYPSYVLQV